MGFQEALDKIGKGIEDLSELNVRTFTGTIAEQVTAKNTQELMAQAQAGELELVGITTMKIDGDVDQFISNNDKVAPPLHQAHSRAVESGQASRQAAFALFTGAIKKAIDAL